MTLFFKITLVCFSFFCSSLSYSACFLSSPNTPVVQWLNYESILSDKDKDLLQIFAHQGDIKAQRQLIAFEFNILNKNLSSKKLYNFLNYYHEQAHWLAAKQALDFITIPKNLTNIQSRINKYEIKINLLRKEKTKLEKENIDQKLIKAALKLNVDLCKLKALIEEVIVPNYTIESSQIFIKYINKKLYNYRLKNLNEDFFKKVNKYTNETLDLLSKT